MRSSLQNTDPETRPGQDVLSGGGETGTLLRAFDWSASSLGVPESWPTALRTLVGVMLGSRQPMFLAWGPDAILIYNDGYAEILGGKHPALGLPFLDVWSEVRDDLRPLLDEVEGGRSVHMDDITLFLNRHGYPEETHFAFSYTPVRDDSDTVAGFFCPCTETTGRIFAERRLIEERERLEQLFQQAPGFVAMVRGPDHRFELANPAYLQLVGHRAVVGRTVAEALPDAAAQGYVGLLDQVYRTGTPFTSTGAKYAVQVLPGGPVNERYVDFVFQPVTDPQGCVTGIFVEGSDVTDRVLGEQALRASEAQFRAFAQALPNHVWTSPPNGLLDWFNDRVYAYSGAQEGMLDGNGWTRMVHPDDLPEAGAKWAASLSAGDTYETEFRLRRADGAYRWHLARAVPIAGPDGIVSRWIGTNTDIEDQKTSAEALQALNATLERRVAEALAQRNVLATVVETTDAFIQVAGLDYRFLAINKASANEFTRIFGVRPEVGDSMLDLLAEYPEQRASVRALWSRALAGEEFTVVEEFGDPDRDRPCYEIKFNTLRGERGERIGAYQFVYDVTERLRDQAALRTNAARLRAMFETSFQLQGLMAVDGTLLDCNSTSLAAIQATRDEVVGQPFWATPWFSGTPGAPEMVRAGIAAAASGTDVRQELALRLPDGVRAYDFSMRPIRDERGEVVGIVPEAMDITHRRDMEEQLRQAQKMEAVGQLTGGIAHDFNNLLAGIVGSLDLLQTRLTQGRTENIERYAKAAMSSAQRAAALTHRLLAFSRRQPLDPRPVNANHLVAGMEDLLRRTIGPLHALEIVTAGGLWTTLCDPNQLESALLNLAINARDAMPDGGKLTIETCNTHLDDAYVAAQRDVRPGQYICVCVTDTGTGMPPEVIARAFEPFFTTKPLGQGTGLGLSMAYGFAKQSEGHLKIYSEEGKGTTMKIYLPRHRGAAEVDQGEAGSGEAPRAETGETVLVVEDEPVIRDLIVEVLQDLGYRALEASDGPSGLKVLQSRERIDLLVTDVGLPGLNGRQLADQARLGRPSLKVLFITGYAENATLANGFLDPGMEMITKPFAVEALATKIRAMIQDG